MFMKDEAFMAKVSGGTATEQDYIDEFKKVNVELTSSEAKKIMDTTDELLSVKELDDESISNIVGGKNEVDPAPIVGGALAMANLLAATGTCIASCVYKAKQRKAELKGDGDKATYYSHKAHDLKGVTMGLVAGIPVAGIVGTMATAAIDRGIHPNR